MTKTSFSLDIQVSSEAVRCTPDQVMVPLAGHSTKTVKKKAEVAPGALVADHPGMSTGDAHSPIAGVVTDINNKGVTITAQEVTAEAVAPLKMAGLSGDDLRAALKQLGVSTSSLCKAQTLVVNGLNPEPGVGIAGWLLSSQAPTLAKGLEAVKNLTGAGTCKLVHSQSASASIQGCSGVGVKAVYPASVNALAVKAATGKENPEDVCVIGVHELFRIGKAMETGLPVIENVCSVGGKIVIAPVGTMLSEVLAAAGVTLDDGDSLLLGGPMCGEAIDGAARGLAKDVFALSVVHNADFPSVTDAACLNCGICVAKCPARIEPNMIARHAEFKMYAATRKYGLDSCFECGMCGFWCTGRKPLLQYIRLAKKELAVQDAQAASCAVNE